MLSPDSFGPLSITSTGSHRQCRSCGRSLRREGNARSWPAAAPSTTGPGKHDSASDRECVRQRCMALQKTQPAAQRAPEASVSGFLSRGAVFSGYMARGSQLGGWSPMLRQLWRREGQSIPPTECKSVISSMSRMSQRPSSPRLSSELSGPFNIGSGHAVTVRYLIETLSRMIGRPDLVRFGARSRACGRSKLRLC